MKGGVHWTDRLRYQRQTLVHGRLAGITFSPAAREEFLAATAFYEAQATGRGQDFITELEHTLS
jgi:hypothetical protein